MNRRDGGHKYAFNVTSRRLNKTRIVPNIGRIVFDVEV